MRRLVIVAAASAVLAISAIILHRSGLPANQAFAFTLFGGCIAAFFFFALRVSLEGRKHHGDHDH